MAQVIEISDLGAGPAVISLNNDRGSSVGDDASSAVSAPPATGLKSVNFGGGLDLLMNDKKTKSSKSSGAGTDINLEDLKELEDDLNNLSADIGGDSSSRDIKAKSKSGLFKSALGGDTGGIKLNIGEKIVTVVMVVHLAVAALKSVCHCSVNRQLLLVLAEMMVSKSSLTYLSTQTR